MHFPGQSIAGIAPFVGPINNTYSSSESNIITLNVIQQQIQPLPETELPTNYWKRPIYGENRDWYQISGNWLMSGYNAISRFNPYTTAPSTAHIVWTKISPSAANRRLIRQRKLLYWNVIRTKNPAASNHERQTILHT